MEVETIGREVEGRIQIKEGRERRGGEGRRRERRGGEGERKEKGV